MKLNHIGIIFLGGFFSVSPYSLTLINISNTPLSCAVEYRLDRIFIKNSSKKIFLPENQQSNCYTLPPHKPVTITIKPSVTLHEPFETYHQELLNQSPHDHHTLKGVISLVRDPRQFYNIHDTFDAEHNQVVYEISCDS